MKKCPYCAETIQDEAIVCRYCGRDLVPDVEKRFNAQVRSTKNPSPPEASGMWELPADYEPPKNDIDTIYKTKIDQLRRGEWVLLATPALSGYNPRHYRGNINEREYLKVEEDLLKWAWEHSDQSPEDLEHKIHESFKRFDVSIFSSVKGMYKHIAANDAKDWLLFRLQSGYSRDAIRKTYRFSVESLVKYAIGKSIFIRDDVAPLERLEKIEQYKSVSPKKGIPNEFFEFVLEEAKKQVVALASSAQLD